jgi:hypothetical protein
METCLVYAPHDSGPGRKSCRRIRVSFTGIVGIELSISPSDWPAICIDDNAEGIFSEPQTSRNAIVRQSVIGGIGRKLSVAVAGDAALFGSDPEIFVPVFEEDHKAAVYYPLCVSAVEDFESHAVISDETIEGGHPQIAVRSLKYIADAVLGKAVVGSPHVEAILSRNVLNQDKESQHAQ